MRSLDRDTQYVYFADVIEVRDGLDTVKKYTPLTKRKLSVSATAGTPKEILAGIVPTYDRYITYHKNYNEDPLIIKEGTALWVDVEPIIDEENNLVIDENAQDYITLPDYVVSKILDRKTADVYRIGISRIGGAY